MAGCISRARFARARANAPDLERAPRPLRFSPDALYARIVQALEERARHTLRLATALDDTLTIRHPGPGFEEWFEEHGHVPKWHATWDKIVRASGELRIPRALRAAREDACLEVSHASAAAFMPLGA